MKKLLPLLLLVVLLVGCEGENPETPNDVVWDSIDEEAATFNLVYWYELPLKQAGVSEENYQVCMRWAFGDDYLELQQRYLNDRWNERHPDLFVMYDSDDRDKAIRKVGRFYLATENN